MSVTFRSASTRRQKIHLSSVEETICEEPDDLDLRLFDWYKESSDSYSAEIIDEDWIPMFPEPDICKKLPETGIDTSTMQRSLCPWQWRLNHDEHREPKILSEAYCLCRKSRGVSGAFCMPIKREVAVLRRILCNPITGHYEYVREMQTITVGCHSVLPRTQFASSIGEHYSVLFNREI
ncbi:unnamed protein product [Dracunculus medinensis]|uniref:Interleukin-17 n=1 Tax=Dracunculus medinensis TaxID=318479 RepID=A0A0N4U4Q6_DRAME|nr:unnamed protein product [Dracunculus medinensis]